MDSKISRNKNGLTKFEDRETVCRFFFLIKMGRKYYSLLLKHSLTTHCKGLVVVSCSAVAIRIVRVASRARVIEASWTPSWASRGPRVSPITSRALLLRCCLHLRHVLLLSGGLLEDYRKRGKSILVNFVKVDKIILCNL